MANLKAGTTVGGAIVWNAGNLAFQPTAPTELLYKNKRVYTEYTPPTAAEVDAVSASKGGTFAKRVTFTEGLAFPPPGSGAATVIESGNGDGAAYDRCNMDIKPHWGLGFYNTTGTGTYPNQRSMFIDVRAGTFTAKGAIKSDIGGIYDGANRVWSNTNKPNKTELNAIWRDGDDVTGNFTFRGWIRLLPNGANNGIRGVMANGSDVNLIGMSDDIIGIGQNHSNLKALQLSIPANLVSPIVRYSDTQKYKIFHEGFAPTASQVGLGRVINELQLKQAGDVARGSNFEFKSLKVVDAPSHDEHAVNLGYMNAEAWVRRPAVTETTNWNTLYDSGSYTVQNASGPGSPRAQAGFNDWVKWGVLTISRGKPWAGTNDNVNYRITQEFKSMDGEIVCYRTSQSHGVWSTWVRILTSSQVSDAYVSKSGDWMTGSLSIPVNNWYRAGAQGAEKSLMAYASATDSLALADWGTTGPGKIVFRVKGNTNLKVAKSASDEVNVFTEYYPPTAEQVGLGRVENFPTLTNLRAIGSGNLQRTFKLGTLAWSDNSSTHLAFMVSATSDYGRMNQTVDIVTASSRGFGANSTLTQANVQNYLNITRMNGAQVFKNQSEATSTSYFLVKEATGLGVYMTSANYSDGVNVTLLSKSRSGSTWDFISTGDVNSVTKPAGMLRADIDYAYTTGQAPTSDDVGLGNVQNIEQLPLNGSKAMAGGLTTPSVIARQWIYAGGQANFLPGQAGAHINWNTGNTQIFTHKGAYGGAISFMLSDGVTNKVLADINADGVIRATAADIQPSAGTEMPKATDPTLESTWTTGFQMRPFDGTAGMASTYPGGATSSTGLLLSFKASGNRHLQLFTNGSATNNADRYWLRNLRVANANDLAFTEVVTESSRSNLLDAHYITANAVIDLGVVT